MDCIPKVRYLSINYIIRSSPDNHNESYPVQLSENFKKVSFSLDLTQLNQFEKIIKNFFGNVAVLTMSTNYDEAYLDANRWELIISSYMPHLRIFDIKHDGCVSKSTSTYHKRNYYKLYWSLNKQKCSHIETKHFNSVTYIYIYGINDNNNTNNNNNNIYFPNVIELTLEQCMEHLDYSLSEILNNILPLHKIRTIIIKNFYLHLKQLIEILYYTYSLNTIEIDYLFYDDIEQFLFKRNNDVEHISKINNVKAFNLLDTAVFRLKTSRTQEYFFVLSYR
ncbi:unnamed protein product [Rotaria sp. Silwood1]|nr:unnamed protein product [Rotaria sp. Silwood1]CAF1687562.1 unnamed protein product [Rotaria sp. Silwood1]